MDEPDITSESKTVSKKGYIKITQDGLGRIYRAETPANIEGIYTEGLQTCIAILIVGMNAVSLIHDMGKLSVDDITGEFKIAKPLFWTVAYNPKFSVVSEVNFEDGGKMVSSNVERKLSRIIMQIEEIIGKGKYLKDKAGGIQLLEAKHGFVALSRKGSFQTDNKPSCILDPIDSEKRHSINQLNSVFLSSGQTMSPDIQFDGFAMQDCPTLLKSPNEMYDILQSEEEIKAIFGKTRDLFATLQYSDRRVSELKRYCSQYDPQSYGAFFESSSNTKDENIIESTETTQHHFS